jgi:hypothetical protein
MSVPFSFLGTQQKPVVQFVAQAYNTNIFAYTKDAKTWTQSTLPSSKPIVCGICVNGKWIMPSRSSITAFTSNDGINWTSITIPQRMSSIAYGNGMYIGVAGFATNSHTCLLSTDGINFTQVTLPDTQNWANVVYGNGTFVISSYNISNILFSTNGMNWTEVATPVEVFYLYFGNGLFVAIYISGTAYLTSPDGKTWTERTLPASITQNNGNCITYGNGVFVLLASGTNVLTSPDGINWTEYNSLVAGDCITFGNGLFMIIGSNNFSTSPDGVNWTMGNMPSNQLWDTAISSNSGTSGSYSSDGGDDEFPAPEKGK